MIPLGHSFFLDPGSDGWWLLEVAGKERVTRRTGPYTSVRHVLQQRVVKLPPAVKAELRALDEAAGAGDEAVAELPVTDASRKGEPSESRADRRDGRGRTRPTSPEDHGPDEPE